MPGVSVPLALRNPIGLAANSALKVRGERGAETLEGAAERAAGEIADDLAEVFDNLGWF